MKIIIDYTVIWIIAGLIGACAFLWMKLQDYRAYNLFLLNKFKPYKKIEKGFMSNSELKLFSILKNIDFLEDYYIFPQVPYSSLLDVKSSINDLGLRFETINNYRSDFVLIKNNQVFLVIELNDVTHKYNYREARDRFVYSALKSAEISYIIFQTKDLINPEKIKEEIRLKLMNH